MSETPDLIDVADTIHKVRLLVTCILMATSSLSKDHRDAIGLVASDAIDKLEDARDTLEDICAKGEA
jgi:hypothetical protein